MKKAVIIIFLLSLYIVNGLCTENFVTSKFDFVPGEKIIFYDDFTAENLGDFPLQWITNGSGEIVTSSEFSGRWFQITKSGYYIPEIRESFTENYTIEFDMILNNSDNSELSSGLYFMLLSTDLDSPLSGGQPGQAGIKLYPLGENIFWNNWSEARDWQGENGSVNYKFVANTKYHLAIWTQKQRVRLYVDDQKILDLPRGLQQNYIYNVYRMETLNEEIKPMVSNFRIAAGFPDMRNKLLSEGKVVSYGIFFDVNSDVLKSESQATIKELAQILSENNELRIEIIGHTDSDGDDTANLELSQKRALSVKNELEKTYKIESSRITTNGKGESEPLLPNNSIVNKAKNRRVEIIKL